MTRRLPSSRETLERLHAAGKTDAEIGRAVGRDHSFIRQVRVGTKTGENLRSALNAFAGGRKVRKPERRKSAKGGLAAVRGSRAGTVGIGAKEFLSRLEKIAAMKGHRVGFKFEWQNLDRQYYAPGPGWTALWGARVHATDPRLIIRKLKHYRRKHLLEGFGRDGDKKQLEGFLNEELKKAFPEGAPGGQFHNAEGLTTVEYSVHVAKSSGRGVRRMRHHDAEARA